MATPNDIHAHLKTVEESSVLVLAPGPLRLAVTPADAIAVELIEWLEAQLGPTGSVGQMLDVLDNARWWVMLWASMDQAERS